MQPEGFQQNRYVYTYIYITTLKYGKKIYIYMYNIRGKGHKIINALALVVVKSVFH